MERSGNLRSSDARVGGDLDTRGVIAEYENARQRLTLTLSSQGPHAIRDVLAAVFCHVEFLMLVVLHADTVLSAPAVSFSIDAL